jgi:hypothetical protein
MRMKTVAFGMVMILALAAKPMLSMAQGAMSQFATAPSTPSFLPTQAPAIATRVPFAKAAPGSSPIVIIQPQPFGGNPPLFGTPNPVFVPGNPVFVPGSTFLPDQFGVPAPVFPQTQQFPPQIMDPVHILVPGQTVIPQAATGRVSATPVTSSSQAYFGNPAVPPVSTSGAGPRVGMSRNDVLRQFGQPSVTIVTSTGETLYFNGGETIRLENGQVTGAR